MDGEKAAKIAQKKKKRRRRKKEEEKLEFLVSSDTFLVLLGLSLMEDILFLCSFMCSQPLTLVYFLFFSTHIFTLLSFLLPLLLTTILSLATFSHMGGTGHHPSYHLGSTCRLLVDLTLLPKQKESDPDLVVSSFGFLSHIFPELQACVDKKQSIPQTQECSTQKKSSEVQTPSPPAAKGAVPISGVLKWEEFQAIGKLYNALTYEIGEYPLLKLEVKNLNLRYLPSSGGVDPSQVVDGVVGVGGRGGRKEVSFERWETPVSNSTMQPAWMEEKGSGLQRFGSMKDKEWRRTLACKLYEERWVKDGEVEVNEEGMDVLWEEHEDENITSKGKSCDDDDGVGEKSNRKRIMLEMVKINASRKKNNSERNLQKMPTEKKSEVKKEEEDCDDDGDDEEEGGKVVRPFYCLQTLRFSTKNMRFGMGKMKNLGKAIKGRTDLIRSSSRRQRGA